MIRGYSTTRHLDQWLQLGTFWWWWVGAMARAAPHQTSINIWTISSLCKQTAQAATAAGHMTNDAGCTKYGCNHRLYHDYPPPSHSRHNNSRFLIVSIISSSAQSLVEQPARPRDPGPGQTVTTTHVSDVGRCSVRNVSTNAWLIW